MNSYMAQLLSHEYEHELCLFARLSSNIIRGPPPSENDRHFCAWFFPIQFIMLFTKCERVINFRPQFPLSAHWTPGIMPPLLATKNDLHFLTQAFLYKSCIFLKIFKHFTSDPRQKPTLVYFASQFPKLKIQNSLGMLDTKETIPNMRLALEASEPC